MTPTHAGWPIEELERALCRLRGHLWAVVSKEPVLGDFLMCRTCGKWTR